MKPIQSISLSNYQLFQYLTKTILLVFLIAGPAFAETTLEKTAEEAIKLQTAPVIVDGEVLFSVVGIPAYPAKRRANEIADRITEAARDEEFDPEKLEARPAEMRTEIVANGKILATALDEDAHAIGIKREIAAHVMLEKIKEIIVQYRSERTLKAIVGMLLRAAIWTVLLLALLFGINWSFRRIDAFLEKNVRERIEKLETRSSRVVQARQLWEFMRSVVRGIRILLILVLVYFFLNSVLTIFPWTRHIARSLLDFALNPLADIAKAVIDYLPSLFFLVVLIFLARYLLKMMHAFFRSIERGRLKFENFDSEWAMPTFKIARMLVIIFTIVLAYPYIPGSQSEAFKGISIFIGVLFSLGSTSAISNVIAGYTMTYRRAFRVGDRVRIDDIVGDVTEMRLLVTHIRSLKNEEIVVPNSKILNSEVVNYSTLAQNEGLILHTIVGIGYEVPWRQVEAMLIMAAQRTSGVLTDPKPFVLQKALADYAVNYELNAYCKEEKKMVALYTELHRNIQDVFNEYGVQIMTPSYEADPPDAKLVAKENWYAAPAEPEGQQNT
jgi:small-conductance mechanosensitive channel